jgi:hypothetical protein
MINAGTNLVHAEDAVSVWYTIGTVVQERKPNIRKRAETAFIITHSSSSRPSIKFKLREGYNHICKGKNAKMG